MPGDPFQCHVYLIENGDQSLLIDPGSRLTFRYALDKIEAVIPFRSIRYFICQHQDPDITGALSLIDQLITRDDAEIVSHWRTNALLKHYGLALPLSCVEERHWQLDAGPRKLDFIFTPYLHFPGAFMTYDRESGVLFSSDIFGGFTPEWSLYARGESYFEEIRSFHEHYMPSREILFHALAKLDGYRLSLIAPQHGSLIRKELIAFMINRLKNLDCGLFLLSQTSTEVKRLSRLNQVLQSFMKNLVLSREFQEVVKSLSEDIRSLLPVEEIEFYTQGEKEHVFHMGRSSLYTPEECELPDALKRYMELDRKQWEERYRKGILQLEGEERLVRDDSTAAVQIVLPLFSTETKKVQGAVILNLTHPVVLDDEILGVLERLSLPFSVALERESLKRNLEMERQKFYEQAIRDPLTGLYTRLYMNEALTRLCRLHERNPAAAFGLLLIDIDDFKSVNDTYGHSVGDLVLQEAAGILLKETRSGDIQVRFGGEEFALFLAYQDPADLLETAERIRGGVQGLRFSGPLSERRITVSIGAAFHRREESAEAMVVRADKALYRAKGAGKNRVEVERPD